MNSWPILNKNSHQHPMTKEKVTIFWFRRDLRLDDNLGLYQALQSGFPVVPIFIFDDAILEHLPKNDARLGFIYESLASIDFELKKTGNSLLIQKGSPQTVWQSLAESYDVQAVHLNKDYEPYALKRDQAVSELLAKNNIAFHTHKDQVIFEESEITKADGLPYTVYTPYKNKWLEKFKTLKIEAFTTADYFSNFYKSDFVFPSLSEIGFVESSIKVQPHNLSQINTYEQTRDFPALNTTSYLSPHLRFGTVSVRKLAVWASKTNAVFLSELIWREFFMQILFHFPKVVTQNFKASYDGIQWRNDEADFEKWCNGQTGYPMVDAGMRQLNATGYMHNRVRMVVASFLCKHLLISWQWGEAYFAQKLLDYDLSANVGNWQWAAGTGCDAAPYFRVFNPEIQLKKFDAKGIYIRTWIPEFDLGYALPMVAHAFARDRAIATYKAGILK